VEDVAHIREMRIVYKILVGKLERKRLLGRPKCGLEDNFRMNCMDIGWEDVDWTHLAQDRDKW